MSTVVLRAERRRTPSSSAISVVSVASTVARGTRAASASPLTSTVTPAGGMSLRRPTLISASSARVMRAIPWNSVPWLRRAFMLDRPRASNMTAPLVEMIDASVHSASTSFSPRLKRPLFSAWPFRLDSANKVQLWDRSMKPPGESSRTRIVACGTPSSGSSTTSTFVTPSASSALATSSKMSASFASALPPSLPPRRSSSLASPLRSTSNQFLASLTWCS